MISATRRSRLPAESTLAESGPTFSATGSPGAMFAEGWDIETCAGEDGRRVAASAGGGHVGAGVR